MEYAEDIAENAAFFKQAKRMNNPRLGGLATRRFPKNVMELFRPVKA
jgi:hypothetical protein